MAKIPIRVNTVAPSWTVTGLVPPEVEAAGKKTQNPEIVGRQVALLMADETRNCQLIYSYNGKQKEIEQGIFANALVEVLDGEVGDDIVVQRLYEMMQAAGAAKSSAS
jgi:NAD(P)-dependent dehydrogenase (short-subunit alcohol dehydrogenase family)